LKKAKRRFVSTWNSPSLEVSQSRRVAKLVDRASSGNPPCAIFPHIDPSCKYHARRIVKNSGMQFRRGRKKIRNWRFRSTPTFFAVSFPILRIDTDVGRSRVLKDASPSCGNSHGLSKGTNEGMLRKKQNERVAGLGRNGRRRPPAAVLATKTARYIGICD